MNLNPCGKEKVTVNNNIFSHEGYQLFCAFTFAGSHPHK